MTGRRPLSRRRFSLLAATAAATPSLAGCGEGTWLGENEAPPLPGERRPVLLLEDALAADPRLAELRVELPPPARNPDWPVPGGNARHALGHLQAGETLRRAWRASVGAGTGGGSVLLASPVVADGRVVAVDADGEIGALDAATGERLWRHAPEGTERQDRLLGGAAAIGDGRVYAVGTDGTVLALEPATGAELWRQALRAPVRAAPTPVDGLVLVPTADSQLLALDGASGEIRWRHAGLFEQAGILGGASPAAAEGVAVATYASGEVVALSLDGGRPLWSETVVRPRRTLAIGSISDIVADPVIDGGRVVVAGASGEMAAFDFASGAREWTAEVTSTQTPWVAGEFLYLLTDRNELVCILRQGGRVRWVSPLGELADPDDPDSPRVRWSGPVLASDRLLLASSEGEAVSVSPYTGEVLGRIDLGGPVSLQPIVADATVYFLTDRGDLLAYR